MHHDQTQGYPAGDIDRIAREGMMFTDAYGEQSCTAGRAGFITGQHPISTGLTKVGLPGAEKGMQKEDPTIATLFKAQVVQFKNTFKEFPQRQKPGSFVP